MSDEKMKEIETALDVEIEALFARGNKGKDNFWIGTEYNNTAGQFKISPNPVSGMQTQLLGGRIKHADKDAVRKQCLALLFPKTR